MLLVKARWTFVDGEFLDNVLVQVDTATDRIVQVVTDKEQVQRLVQEAAQKHQAVQELDVALMPGFVNCHSHAFQRELRGLGETFENAEDSFWTWRIAMYKLVDGIKDSQRFYDITHRCFSEMRSRGITTVGEFHYFHHSSGTHDYAFDVQVMQAAVDAKIRLVLLNTFYCFGGFGDVPLNESQQRFKSDDVGTFLQHLDQLQKIIKDNQWTDRVHLGVVAHSLRAVSVDQLRELHQGSVERQLPFHLHLEEQPKEVEEAKRAHDGKTPMRILLDTIQAQDLSLTTAVHCNHTEENDLKEFIDKGGNVCICPLTEGNLGDGIMQDLFICAKNVCLGTDCNARIDMLEEMRWLEYTHRLKRLQRGIAAKALNTLSSSKALFRMATANGARSLGLKVGKIAPGYFADFLHIDINAPTLNNQSKQHLAASLIFGCATSEVIQHEECK